MLLTLEPNWYKIHKELTNTELSAFAINFYDDLVRKTIKKVAHDSDQMTLVTSLLFSRPKLTFKLEELSEEYNMKKDVLIHTLLQLHKNNVINFLYKELIELEKGKEQEYTLEFICY